MLTGSNEEKRGTIPSSYVAYLEDDDFTTLKIALEDILSRYNIHTLHGRDRFLCQQVLYAIYFNFNFHYCIEYNEVNPFNELAEGEVIGALDDFENDFWESVEYAVSDINGIINGQSEDIDIEDLTNDLLESFGDNIQPIVKGYMMPEIRKILLPVINSDGTRCGYYIPFIRNVRLDRHGFLYWEM